MTMEGDTALAKPERLFAKKRLREFLAAGAASIGGFSLGASLGWSSPALSSLQEREDFGVLDGAQETWIASSVAIGACLASPLAGFCLERFGRKETLILFCAPYVLGWLVIVFSSSILMMIVGRLITGLCGGVVTMTSPIYITEISSDAVRGTLGSSFMIMIVLGTITTYGVGAITSWSTMSLFNAFPPAILLICLLFVPESPVYLLAKGKSSASAAAIRWLRPYLDGDEFSREMEKLETQVEESKSYSRSFKDLFGDQVWRPTGISMTLVFFNQLSGIQAVLFYAAEIVESTNTGLDPNLAAIFLGLAVIVASAFMDKAGRRTLLLLSEVGMTVSFTALGTFFYLKEQNNGNNPANLSWLPLVALIAYILSYAVGLGPLPRVVGSEIIPLHVKGLATSAAFTFNWILVFAVTKTFKDLTDALNESGFFWLYAGICAVGIVCIYFVVPETKGKSMQEIQMQFQQKT